MQPLDHRVITAKPLHLLIELVNFGRQQIVHTEQAIGLAPKSWGIAEPPL